MVPRILFLIDVQNDFITGALGNEAAIKAVPKIVNKIKNEKWDFIFITRDAHYSDYLNTAEGKKLPVSHCIVDTEGWEIEASIWEAIQESGVPYSLYVKHTFGLHSISDDIEYELDEHFDDKESKPYFEFCGFCTDICVISNVLLLKASWFEWADIVVDQECCAGTTPENHEAALNVMRSCQIDIKGYEPKKKMLVVTAMREEMDKFLANIPNFIQRGYEVIPCVAGIGKVNAAMNVQKVLVDVHPDVVLDYGFCGAFKRGGYSVGDGVSVDGAIYNDVWCGTGRYGQVQGMPHTFETLRLSDEQVADFVKAGLCKSVFAKSKSETAVPSKHFILTGDKFVESAYDSVAIKRHFDFDTHNHYSLVDMEAAAIAQVCYANDVPLIVFKVVSDITDKYEGPNEHNKEYEEFKKDF